jgi:adenylosuccinate synthase
LDYIDPRVREGLLPAKARAFVEKIEADIGRKVDWLGTGPGQVMDRQGARVLA